jgi:hypothetical protein
MKIMILDGEQYVDRQEAADELAEDYNTLFKTGLWPKLRAKLELAFEHDPEQLTAILKTFDEQTALADAEAAKHIARLRRGAETH